MYLNLQQARSGDIQHLNFSRKAINHGWSDTLPQPRTQLTDSARCQCDLDG
jgi:hypothetical protein